MLFNSIDFAIFLPVVFVLYWFLTNNNLKLQNLLLVVASYLFYGWWDWRFLSLILFSTLVDYFVGLKLFKQANQTKRKILLYTSIIVNLGFLGFFKYFNFFLDSFISAFSFFGTEIQANSLNIILPVGISFYTFQTLSYSIDVFKRKLEPTKDFIAFSAFVSFFPQLVAGPIERATNLLPQLFRKRHFEYNNALQGISQIVWGLFKKIVIADNCALIINEIFDDYSNYSGSTLLLGAVLFAFQIYGDFSGYSDIAIGTARLFGFRLKQNFAYPYFSRDFGEFWRRWHISLNTWFRDYLYIPLGGSRGHTRMTIRNIFIVFMVSGFWHGAKWNFLIWGFINACFFLPLMLAKKNRRYLEPVKEGKGFPSIKELLQMGITFGLAVFAWIFFRADDLPIAFAYISNIFSYSLFTMPYVFGVGIEKAFITLLLIFVMVVIEWIGRTKEVPIYLSGSKNFTQWAMCFLVILMVFLFGAKQQEFIYFQF